MALNSIEVEWSRFAAMVLPEDAPQVQKDEMKKAFFAGAMVLCAAIEEIAQPHVSEEAGVAYIEERMTECEAFYRKMMSEYVSKN